MSDIRHPMQPVYLDPNGTARFKRNKIVDFLLNWASARGMSLNQLALMPFDDEDREQLAQLIGYSVGGFCDLSYTSDAARSAAWAEAEQLLKKGG